MTERLFVRLAEDLSQGPESGTPPATLCALPVHAPLRAHVAHVLSYCEDFAAGQEIVERVLPDGAVRVMLHPAAAVQAIHAGGGQRPLQDVAAVLDVGERRLQQLFRQHVGLSPKSVSRLARLHGLLRALRRSAAPAWAQLAPELGYYDQAHLVNEFRALSGLTPGQFLVRSAVSGSSKSSA